MGVSVRAFAEAVDPAGAPPRFHVETDRPWARIELATEALLLGGALAARRSPERFVASPWSPAPGGALIWSPPPDAWAPLASAPLLYYRALAADDRDGLRGVEATVGDLDADAAPAIAQRRVELPAGRTRLSAGLDWLAVAGNRLVDAAGAPVVLRGVTRSGTGDAIELTRDEVVDIVRGWGANVVRLPLNQVRTLTRWEDLAALDRAIAWAAREGAYTLLTVRRLGGDDAPLPDENTLRLWRALAARYRREPAVLYEPFAFPREPTAGELAGAAPDDVTGWAGRWRAWALRMVAAIRRVHARAVIVVAGWDSGRDLRSYPLVAPGGHVVPGLVYGARLRRDDSAEGLTDSPAAIDDWLGGPSLRRTSPVVVTDWGGTAADATWGEMVVERLRGLAGWTAWSWTEPPLLVDPSEGGAAPTPFGEVVKDALGDAG